MDNLVTEAFEDEEYIGRGIAIFTIANCPWCDKAKLLLDSIRKEDPTIDLITYDFSPVSPEDRKNFLLTFGRQTFPLILSFDSESEEKKKIVGGFVELSRCTTIDEIFP